MYKCFNCDEKHSNKVLYDKEREITRLTKIVDDSNKKIELLEVVKHKLKENEYKISTLENDLHITKVSLINVNKDRDEFEKKLSYTNKVVEKMKEDKYKIDDNLHEYMYIDKLKKDINKLQNQNYEYNDKINELNLSLQNKIVELERIHDECSKTLNAQLKRGTLLSQEVYKTNERSFEFMKENEVLKNENTELKKKLINMRNTMSTVQEKYMSSQCIKRGIELIDKEIYKYKMMFERLKVEKSISDIELKQKDIEISDLKMEIKEIMLKNV